MNDFSDQANRELRTRAIKVARQSVRTDLQRETLAWIRQPKRSKADLESFIERCKAAER